MDSHHMPEGTHSLAPRPGSLDRLTFHENRPRPPPRSRYRKKFEDEHENDDEEDSVNWSAWQDLHLQPFRFERNASSDWATRGWLAEPQLGIEPEARLRTRCFGAAAFAHSEVASEGWCPRSDLHRHWTRFKCAASPLGYAGVRDLRITICD